MSEGQPRLAMCAGAVSGPVGCVVSGLAWSAPGAPLCRPAVLSALGSPPQSETAVAQGRALLARPGHGILAFHCILYEAATTFSPDEPCPRHSSSFVSHTWDGHWSPRRPSCQVACLVTRTSYGNLQCVVSAIPDCPLLPSEPAASCLALSRVPPTLATLCSFHPFFAGGGGRGAAAEREWRVSVVPVFFLSAGKRRFPLGRVERADCQHKVRGAGESGALGAERAAPGPGWAGCALGGPAVAGPGRTALAEWLPFPGQRGPAEAGRASLLHPGASPPARGHSGLSAEQVVIAGQGWAKRLKAHSCPPLPAGRAPPCPLLGLRSGWVLLCSSTQAGAFASSSAWLGAVSLRSPVGLTRDLSALWLLRLHLWSFPLSCLAIFLCPAAASGQGSGE